MRWRRSSEIKNSISKQHFLKIGHLVSDFVRMDTHMFSSPRPLLILLLLVSSSFSFAAGVRGTIKGDDGEALPFTTIFIKELGTGTTSNAQGFYEIVLTPGTYTLTFQYLGHTTQ